MSRSTTTIKITTTTNRKEIKTYAYKSTLCIEKQVGFHTLISYCDYYLKYYLLIWLNVTHVHIFKKNNPAAFGLPIFFHLCYFFPLKFGFQDQRQQHSDKKSDHTQRESFFLIGSSIFEVFNKIRDIIVVGSFFFSTVARVIGGNVFQVL